MTTPQEQAVVPTWARWTARFLVAVVIVLCVVLVGAFAHVAEYLFNVGWNALGG